MTRFARVARRFRAALNGVGFDLQLQRCVMWAKPTIKIRAAMTLAWKLALSDAEGPALPPCFPKREEWGIWRSTFLRWCFSPIARFPKPL